VEGRRRRFMPSPINVTLCGDLGRGEKGEGKVYRIGCRWLFSTFLTTRRFVGGKGGRGKKKGESAAFNRDYLSCGRICASVCLALKEKKKKKEGGKKARCGWGQGGVLAPLTSCRFRLQR